MLIADNYKLFLATKLKLKIIYKVLREISLNKTMSRIRENLIL